MKKIWFTLSTVVALCATSGRSDAAVTLVADMDVNTPGIQSTIAANVGDTLPVDFIFELSGASTLSAWQYSIAFNTANLAFVSREEIAPPGFGFLETDNQMVDDLANGRLFRIGYDSGGGPDAAFGPFNSARVVFNVVGTSPSPTGFDVTPGFFEPDLDTFLVNTTFEEFSQLGIPITFTGGSIASVAAIPEPSSMALIGLVGAVGAYRARRRLRAEKVVS